MTNACVSHEMRNPLNAMSAVNFLKKKLYQELREVLLSFFELCDNFADLDPEAMERKNEAK